MKVTIIGCGDITKIHRFAGMSESESNDLVDRVGKLLAESNVEIVLVPARGIPYEVAKAYKKYGGRKVIGAVPFDDVEFGLNHIAEYRHISDEDVNIGDWYDLNGRIASWSEVTVCIGLSAGVICDIAMLKYHYKYKGSDTKLVVFKNTISQPLPKELEEELKHLHYITSVDELKPFLRS